MVSISILLMPGLALILLLVGVFIGGLGPVLRLLPGMVALVFIALVSAYFFALSGPAVAPPLPMPDLAVPEAPQPQSLEVPVPEAPAPAGV